MRQRFDQLGDLNNKRNNNPISIKFILFVFIFFVGMCYYISLPDQQNQLTKNRTFEEKLEYGLNKLQTEKENTNINIKPQSNINSVQNNELQFEIIDPPSSLPSSMNIVPKQIQSKSYNQLLAELANYPTRNAQNLQVVLNKLLTFNGYPENLVKVVATDINQSHASANNNYEVANFNFETGNINVSNYKLERLNNKELIAILAHELDHFDKLANLCKSIGYDKFREIMGKNNVKPDAAFWINAAKYANDKNFKTQVYEDALNRMVTINDLEMTSSYSDLYKLAEQIRNPLEISAYSISDSIYRYYNIPITEDITRKITKKFNDVDIALNNLAEKNGIPNARVVLFDYLYAKAILKNLPEFNNYYQTCVNNKNGDLTTFWLAFEGSIKSFYSRSATTQSAYDKIYKLLNETEALAKQNISQNDILLAYKYKINTLKSTLVYPKAKDYLGSIIIDYLDYLKKNNIMTDSNQELIAILTLICIDNNLTTQNNNEISLYYIKLPDTIKRLYNIGSNKNKYAFIYNNPAFIAQKGSNETNEQVLIDLLNKNRLDIRIKS